MGRLINKCISLFIPFFITLGIFHPVLAQTSSLKKEGPKRPNILLIVTDDMGYSDLEAFGGEISTPNLDKVAQSGVRMTNFYVSPACSPTRSMLLSGNDNHVAGLGSMAEAIAPNQKGKPGYEGYLNDRVVSIASLLKDAGYRTYISGKWHLGKNPAQDPSQKGFEKSFVLLQGGASHFDDEKELSPNYGATYRHNGKTTHVPKGFYSTQFFSDKIIEWTGNKQGGQPFFAYLSFTAPHDPLHLPNEWLDKNKGQYDEGYDALRKKRMKRMKAMGLVPQGTALSPRLPKVPAWRDLNSEQKKAQARKMEIYVGMVENIDFHIGRVLNHLKKTGQYDDTLILFFSDNGANGWEMHSYPDSSKEFVATFFDNRYENMGKKGSGIAQGPGWAQASMTPFRLYKAFTAEGGILSPLIVAGPEVVRKGENNDSTAHVMDVAPTLLEWAGVSYPPSYQGRKVLPMKGKSMAPFLSKKKSSIRKENDILGWELFGQRALRKGKWKIIWIIKPQGKGDWELFDLSQDPSETQDLSKKYPVKLKELVKDWKNYAKENGVILPVR